MEGGDKVGTSTREEEEKTKERYLRNFTIIELGNSLRI